VLKSSFPPVVDGRTRLLVLGSLPGEASLALGQYYAHPQNQFWRLMESVAGRRLVNAAYEDRLASLLDAGVGLWDVVGEARRRGSLDGALRDIRPNALRELIGALPRLRAVAFNGATASTIGRRQLGDDVAATLVTLPSSSPAHTLAFDVKRAAWARLGDLISDGDASAPSE